MERGVMIQSLVGRMMLLRGRRVAALRQRSLAKLAPGGRLAKRGKQPGFDFSRYWGQRRRPASRTSVWSCKLGSQRERWHGAPATMSFMKAMGERAAKMDPALANDTVEFQLSPNSTVAGRRMFCGAVLRCSLATQGRRALVCLAMPFGDGV